MWISFFFFNCDHLSLRAWSEREVQTDINLIEHGFLLLMNISKASDSEIQKSHCAKVHVFACFIPTWHWSFPSVQETHFMPEKSSWTSHPSSEWWPHGYDIILWELFISKPHNSLSTASSSSAWKLSTHFISSVRRGTRVQIRLKKINFYFTFLFERRMRNWT